MGKEDVILLSYKAERDNATCSNIDGPRNYRAKWSKSERERQISYDSIYMWNRKNNTNELIYKAEDSKLWKQSYDYQRGKATGRDKLQGED